MADWTGVGRYSTGLVRALVARGDLDVVQLVTRTEQAPSPDASIVVVPGHPFSPFGAMRFSSAVRRIKPDVMHCLHFPTPIPARHPLVVTLHDLAPLVVPGLMGSPVSRAVYRRWNQRAVHVADRIIVPSRYTDDDILRILAPAIPGLTTRIRVIPEAADDFATGPVGNLPTVADEFDGRYVLGFSSTRPHKGLTVLLRAFGAIAEEHPDVALVLVGEPLRDVVLNVVESEAAMLRIRFTGPVDDPTLRALYTHAAVFAFPSVFEGFGLPPLEAMALGAPVVTTTGASLPEVVGDAAYTVPPYEVADLAVAIDRLLDEPAERERLIALGHARAQQFSWRRAAEQTVGVYREAMAR